MWISQIPTCWHLITSVYRAQGLACPWEGFNGAYLNKWNHTYRKKNWWFVTVSFGIRETAKLKSISTRFSLLVSDTTPVSETFFSNSRVVKRVPFSTFITRSASEVFYLLATVSSHSIFPVLYLENCIQKIQNIFNTKDTRHPRKNQKCLWTQTNLKPTFITLYEW